MSRPPNFLIVMPDQWRGDCLSCAGHPVVRTPHVDRLAAEGLRFAQAYTTSPICMPARSSFLSGLYNHNHGQWANVDRCDARLDTFAHHLQEAGYHTCHLGKSHYYEHRAGEHLNEYLPFMRELGWEEVRETTGPWATTHTDSIMTDHWRESGCLQTFRDDYERRRRTNPVEATWPSPMPEGEHLEDFVGRLGVEFLRSYEGERPFCCCVGFGGPHEPWDPPPAWADRYDRREMDAPLPPADPKAWVPPEAAVWQREEQGNPLGLSAANTGPLRALYYAKISHVDWWVGQLLEALRSRERLENTVVIFWSDHGEMLGDKGRLYKSVMYESATRVPLIVRLPEYEHPGAVCESLVSQIDVFPTLLELAGCSTRAQQFGRSLVPALEDPAATVREEVFSEYGELTMVRDRQHKLVVNGAGHSLLLYDLQADPREERNLVGHPDYRETEAHLRERLLRWLLETQLRKNARPRYRPA